MCSFVHPFKNLILIVHGLFTDSRVTIPASYSYHSLAVCCDLVIENTWTPVIIG